MKLHIKRAYVKVLSGKDRGKGEVLWFSSKAALLIEESIVTKHKRPDQDNPEGALPTRSRDPHFQTSIDGRKDPVRTGRVKNENGKVGSSFQKNGKPV